MYYNEIKAHSFLASCLELPEGEIIPRKNRSLYNCYWGFTIYRTCHTSSTSSDGKRSTFLDPLRTEMKTSLAQMEGMTEELLEQIWSLFRLDTREDKAILDGADMDALRGVYKEGEIWGPEDPTTPRRILTTSHPSPPMNATIDGGPSSRRVFLADEEVLNTVGCTDWQSQSESGGCGF